MLVRWRRLSDMALRRCWRLTAAAPRLLWRGAVRPGASVPGGRSSVSCLDHAHSLVSAAAAPRSRSFSAAPPSTAVTYGQLKQLLAGGKALVIDVREPWELREYGSIPGALNVPLGQVSTALQLAPEDFRDRYGGDMPEHTDHIVFSCLAGIRSEKALREAAALGYKDIHHYPGGWKDWATHEQQH